MSRLLSDAAARYPARVATHPRASKRKPAKPTVETLSALGVERLAELLVDAARADAALKRALTLEVARDGKELAEEVDRQLQRIQTAKTRLNAARATTLARELERLLRTVTERLGAFEPEAAVERLLAFATAAPTILARRTGEGRPLVEAFNSVGDRVASLLPALPSGPGRAGLLVQAYRLARDEPDALPGLMAALAKAADATDRAGLRALVEADLAPLQGSAAKRGAAGERFLWLTNVLALIADADGDVDAFRAVQERREPGLRDHLGLTNRLLAASRPAEALEVLDATPAGFVRASPAYADMRIEVLEALGRREDAQGERWALFWTTLSPTALRGFLKRLPDFEDVEREEAALAHAERHQDSMAALAFFLAWRDLRRAAAVVRRPGVQLDGDARLALINAAEALAHQYPLAATLLYRRVIDAALARGKPISPVQVASDLMACASLAASVTQSEGRPDHAAYVRHLRARYGRHKSLWRRLTT